MNPLIQMLNNNVPVNNAGNIMQRAMAAMMSGQTPQQFLSSIPQLQGLDISNPQALAQKLCADRGINYEQAKQQITNSLNNNR